MNVIKLNTKYGKVCFTISPSNKDSFNIIPLDEALIFNESQYQLKEGNSYDFKIDEGFTLEEVAGIVTLSPFGKKNIGRITPNIYVGSLKLDVFHENDHDAVGLLIFEVLSTKTTYREDYRMMLEDIAEKCTDLLMQHSSPVIQNFIPDFKSNSQTAYQRFAFIKSIIESNEFETAINKIISFPNTRLEIKHEESNQSTNPIFAHQK